MSRPLKGAWVFISCLLLVACSRASQPGEVPRVVGGHLDLGKWDFNNNGVVKLSGEWAFYWQELLTPTQIESRKSSKFVQVPTSWTSYALDGRMLPSEGYATYHLTLQLDPSQSYGLYIAGEGIAYNLWVDRQLVVQNGHVADNPQEMIPYSKPEVAFFHPGGDTTDFVIQISNFQDRKGGFQNAILLGLSSQIQNRQRVGWAVDGFVMGIFLIIGVFDIFIFAFRPKDKSLLYFALWSFISLVRAGLLDQELILTFLPGMSWEVAQRIEYLTLYVSPPLYLLFIYTLYPKDILRSVLQTAIGIGALFSLTMLFSNTLTLSYTYTIYYSVVLLGIPYFIFFIGRIVKRKREGARYIAAASLFGFIVVILEYLYLQNVIPFEIDSVYAFLVFILIQVILVSSRFSKSFQRVEVLSKDLEKRNIDLLESEEKYRGFFEGSKDMIFIANPDGHIKTTNPASLEILGYSQDELKKMNLSEIIVNAEDGLTLENTLRRDDSVRDYELELQRKDGNIFHALITLSPRKNGRHAVTQIQGTIHDISALKQAEYERIRAHEYERLAFTDPLTNIYNRRFFNEIIIKEWERAKRSNSSVSIVIFDIDHFKQINDKHGHLIGDQVLANLAAFCDSNMRNMDIFARYGGDEFIILMPDTDQESAHQTIERLRASVAKTSLATYENEPVFVTVSAGLANWNGKDATNVHVLLEQADRALYISKQSRRNRVTIWESE